MFGKQLYRIIFTAPLPALQIHPAPMNHDIHSVPEILAKQKLEWVYNFYLPILIP